MSVPITHKRVVSLWMTGGGCLQMFGKVDKINTETKSLACDGAQSRASNLCFGGQVESVTQHKKQADFWVLLVEPKYLLNCFRVRWLLSWLPSQSTWPKDLPELSRENRAHAWNLMLLFLLVPLLLLAQATNAQKCVSIWLNKETVQINYLCTLTLRVSFVLPKHLPKQRGSLGDHLLL